jgi:branched-chain amino acid transport system ATP-binding protein
MSALLSCRALGAGYGPVKILRDFDLELSSGTVCAVLGPNGAGKTTLMLTLAGLLARQSGEIAVEGKPLSRGRGSSASRAGVVLVPDDRALFATLTVKENILVAAKNRSTGPEKALELFPALEKRWTLAAGSLSGGEQQMLAMARAIVQEPRVLLIDEMSMGLAPTIVEQLLPVVRRIADESQAAVVLVEQHVGLALEVADEAVVLVHGEVVLRGAADALAKEPAKLEAAYLGKHAAA